MLRPVRIYLVHTSMLFSDYFIAVKAEYDISIPISFKLKRESDLYSVMTTMFIDRKKM